MLFLPIFEPNNFDYLLQHSMVTTLFTFPANTFTFDSPSTSLGYISKRQYQAKFKIALILVQNEAAFDKHQIDESFQSDFSKWCLNECPFDFSSTITPPTKQKDTSRNPTLRQFGPFSMNIKNFPTKPPLHPRSTDLCIKLHKYLIQLTSIAKLGPDLVKSLFHLINAPERNTISTNDIIGDPIETSSVIRISKRFRNLCWAPLDRNAGCLFVCCPQFYFDALKKLFYDDSHYEHSNLTPEYILSEWKKFYTKEKLAKLFKWPTKTDKLPYSYALMKNKDVLKQIQFLRIN